MLANPLQLSINMLSKQLFILQVDSAMWSAVPLYVENERPH